MVIELVGGPLISASVQVLLERLSSPEVVAHLRRKLKHADFEGLYRRLMTSVISVTAVLEDAEQKRMRRINGVNEWLDDLQEALFDADDLLAEIQSDASRRNKKSKVGRLFARSQVERKIEKILARIEDVGSKKELLGLKQDVAEKQISQRLPSTSLVQESEVYGREAEKGTLIKLLLSNSNDDSGNRIGVLPIVGMGGLGKTTLVQLVYNDDRIVEKFELRAWVCVSENMDVFWVTKTVIEAVTSVSCSITDLNLLQLRLKEALKGKKFFIVMDDVWNEKYDDWQIISRPFLDSGARGSKIIVTTRSEKVAKIITTDGIYRLGELLFEDCLQLFSKHAFGNGSSADYPELQDIGRKVIVKCKGLPLAVKTLGGLLRSTRDVGDWERILKSEIWDLADEESNILPALRLSYHYLPSNLKRCFAYCSLFPKAFEFEKEQMVELWSAENLLPNPNTDLRAEEVGEQYFNELTSRSFFQRSTTRGSISLWYTLSDHFVLTQGENSSDKQVFVMHDLLHDLAKYVSTECCLHLQDGSSGDIIGKKVRRLSYTAAENDPYKRFNYVKESAKLRTFLPLQHCESLNCNCISLKLVRDWLMKLRCLRVLSLSGYMICKLPGSIGGLKHLRYLDLSHTCIVKLPKPICKLFNLQTLKLNSCKKLVKLPKKMSSLVNMRYLDVRFCNNLVEMPIQMSKMKNLQVLSTFIVGKTYGTKICELREHSDLRGELCIKRLENVGSFKDAIFDHPKLMEKKRLEALALEWSDHIDDDSTQARNVLDMLLPNRALKKLRIDKYSGTGFPNWVGDGSFGNVVVLELYKCRCCKSLPPLGQLTSLKTLTISQFDAVVNVGPEFYGNESKLKPFSSLEALNFYSMPSWERWIQVEDVGAFEKLKELEISNCEKLTGNLPSFLPSLTEFNISGCKNLVPSLPRMPAICELKIGDMEDQLQTESLFKALKQMEKCPKHLRISNFSSSIPAGFLPTSLETLDLVDCKNLEFPLCHKLESLEVLFMHRSCDSLQSLPLDYFPRLNKLAIEGSKSLKSISLSDVQSGDIPSLSFIHIMNCPSLAMFPKDGLRALNLFFLQIEDCLELKSLPEKMFDLLPSLELLLVKNCPEINSFPDGGLPLNLSSLIIIGCDKIIASRKSWNLGTLTNLTSLTIEGSGEYEDLKNFPEEGLLPYTVIDIVLCKFPGLVELDTKGLRQLSFLKELYISNCPKLSKIPDEGLPTSVECFEIENCPRLERKCRAKNGKYWSKITRIHCVKIGDEIVS